jgi:hypothetical protein
MRPECLQPHPAVAYLFLVRRLARTPVKRYLSILLATAAVLLVDAPHSKPESATIINVPSERRDYGFSIANVKVRFTDGHTEIWLGTASALCRRYHPRVTSAGRTTLDTIIIRSWFTTH